MGAHFSGDWSAMLRDFTPAVFQERLTKALLVAHGRIGQDFQRRARAKIRGRVYAPNSPLTIAIKGSSTPLVDGGDLFQGLGYEIPRPTDLNMGVIRAVAGDKIVNIGAVLHEGGVVDLDKYPNVRKALWARVRKATSPERVAKLRGAQRAAVTAAAASIARKRTGKLSDKQRRAWFGRMKREGKLQMGAGGGSKRIVIPPRPFITTVVDENDFQAGSLRHYEAAIRAAFGGQDGRFTRTNGSM